VATPTRLALLDNVFANLDPYNFQHGLSSPLFSRTGSLNRSLKQGSFITVV
jgi:hypothetical protein